MEAVDYFYLFNVLFIFLSLKAKNIRIAPYRIKEIENNIAIYAAANAGFAISKKENITPTIPKASIHPQPFMPTRCISIDPLMLVIETNIIQNPAK